jgi:predicted permease
VGLGELRLNGRVLAAAVVIAGATPFVFGLLPAWRMTPTNPAELRDGGRVAGATRRGRRLRQTIVALQTAAAVVLMVQIGLFLRTTWKLSAIAAGFDPERVLTFRVSLPPSRYAQPAAIDRFVPDLLQRLRTLPGVETAGLIDRLPIADDEQMARLTADTTIGVPTENRPLIARSAIAGDALAALRVPLRRGRLLTDADVTGDAPVALINDEAARRFWPGRNPIGSRLALDGAASAAWLEVVGVVGNLRNSDADQGPLPQVFVTASRQRSPEFAVVVKSLAADPLQLAPVIRAQVAAIDRNLPIYDIASMKQVLFDDLASTYVLSAILSAIGLIAVTLSAAGVYALVAYSVTQRRREIGVRMALGSTPGAIVRLITVHSTRPLFAGAVAGLMAATALSALLAVGVPDIDPRDPVSYVGAIVLLLVAAALATAVPARRAASVNPSETLRGD